MDANMARGPVAKRARLLDSGAAGTQDRSHLALDAESAPDKGKQVAVCTTLNDLPFEVLGEVCVQIPKRGSPFRARMLTQRRDLCQVLCLLVPLDLLNLSRTDKALRTLLMSRSSSFYWKQAQDNLADKPPPCPETLSEPAYCNFLFTNHCHVMNLVLLISVECFQTSDWSTRNASWRRRISSSSRKLGLSCARLAA